MTSIGETLRHERERRNLGLQQVSQELKISEKFLEAIEEEDFGQLPRGVFAKSFVRQYARLLGLDEEEAANEVQRILVPSQELPLPDANTPAASHLGDLNLPSMKEWQSLSDGRGFSWSSPLPALMLVVVAMLGCSLVYGWWQRARRPVVSAAPPVTHSQEPAQEAVTKSTPEAPQPTQANAPTPEQPSAATGFSDSSPVSTANVETVDRTKAVEAAPVEGPVTVAVTAAEPVWVLARTDGKYSFSGTLATNETRTVAATSSVMLRVGNAGGVTITLNGKPIGEVGPRGQVRTVQLTSGGFQIVAPKPSAPAADPI